MTATEITLLGVMPCLLAGSAFFSGSETALFSLSEAERAQLERTSPLSGRAAAALMSNQRMLLITILLGNMVVNVLFFVMASVLVLHADTAIMQAAYTLGPLLAVILFGEVTPKLIATGQRVRWCAVFAPALLALHRLITPVRILLNSVVVTPAARLAGAVEPPALSAEELGELLELSAREGTINPIEAELLDDVIELSSLRVYDIMTPRVDLVWVDVHSDRAAVEQIARQAPHSRLPVCDGSPDRGVIGVLDLRKYLSRKPDSPPLPIRSVMEKPLFVPEQARLDQLLALFKSHSSLTAIPVDEYGGVAGIVAFRDIARRMAQSFERDESGFGDARRPEIERIDGERWRVSGRLSVHDLIEAFGPTGRRPGGAVAGLINAELGRIAAPGDRVRLGNVELAVETMRGRAIDTVIVSLIDASEAQS